MRNALPYNEVFYRFLEGVPARRLNVPIFVRYGETDMMGVVYHANYILYFEDAREKYLAELGFPYVELEERGLISPVLHVECDYGESLRYGDKVVVQLAVTALKPTKVQFRYRVFDGESVDFDTAKPFATGMSEHCLIRRDDFKPVSMKKAVPELYECYKAALEPDFH